MQIKYPTQDIGTIRVANYVKTSLPYRRIRLRQVGSIERIGVAAKNPGAYTL